MKRTLPLISIFFILLMPLIAQAEILVEAVVAVLSFENGEPLRKVIYLSDLERHRLFFETPEKIIVETPGNKTKREAHLFIQRRNALIEQVLFLREARRFAIKKPGKAEVLAKLKEIRQRFQTESDFEKSLQASALSLPELEEEIALHLWVDKLLWERIQEFIFISPKAIEAYQLDHLDAFLGQEIKTIEKKITQILSHQKEVEKKRAYLKRLKEKIQIEFVLSENEITAGNF